MIKRIINCFLIGVIFSCASTKFTPEAVLIQSNNTSKFETPTKILFQFEAKNPHFIYHYVDLSKKIRQTFNKSGIITLFNYEMNVTEKSLEADVAAIPKREF